MPSSLTFLWGTTVRSINHLSISLPIFSAFIFTHLRSIRASFLILLPLQITSLNYLLTFLWYEHRLLLWSCFFHLILNAVFCIVFDYVYFVAGKLWRDEVWWLESCAVFILYEVCTSFCFHNVCQCNLAQYWRRVSSAVLWIVYGAVCQSVPVSLQSPQQSTASSSLKICENTKWNILYLAIYLCARTLQLF